MDFKNFLVIALMLMLCASVFAEAPVITGVTVSPVSVTDHNYSNWKSPNFMTLVASVTGEDINVDGCGYAIDDSWSYPTATDFNIVSNTYTILVQALAVDDTNWGISCKNNSGEEAFFFRTIYLDANAPSVTSTASTSNQTITITATDAATNTGNGAGVKRIYYKLDSSAWTYSTSNPLTITPEKGENHTLLYYAVDNVDNNSGATTILSRTFYTGTIQNQACGLINLVTLLFAALIILSIMVLGMTGNIDEKVIVALVVFAILGVICIVILGAFITPFCGLP